MVAAGRRQVGFKKEDVGLNVGVLERAPRQLHDPELAERLAPRDLAATGGQERRQESRRR